MIWTQKQLQSLLILGQLDTTEKCFLNPDKTVFYTVFGKREIKMRIRMKP